MLRYIQSKDLHKFPHLAATMFRDRADQFKTRLDWDVAVDRKGEERDQYDACNPLYVVWQQPDGSHGGSMRLMPTTGRTMVNEVFSHLNGGRRLCSPRIWESTRFCLSRTAGRNVAGALILGGTEIMRNLRVHQYAGVFDRRMVRIYKRLGFSPEIIGSQGEGRDRICLGMWTYSEAVHSTVRAKAGISSRQSRYWFDLSFGRLPLPALEPDTLPVPEPEALPA